MTAEELALKKLAFLETCIADLKEADFGRIESDIKEERFVTHTLQLAIQAALDASSHVISQRKLGEPKTNREMFSILEQRDLLSTDVAQVMKSVVGFRNVIVHSYEKVDVGIVKDIATNHSVDLLAFSRELRATLTDS